MSEEALERSQEAIDEAKKAAAGVPVMPFDDNTVPGGQTPPEPPEPPKPAAGDAEAADDADDADGAPA